MSVQCSMCGKVSQDHEFCDHCNADLGKTGQSLPPERCPLTADGVLLSAEQRHLLLFPESALMVQAEGRAWRIHWISAYDWRERGPQIEKRLTWKIPCLPTGRLVEDPLGRWLVYDTAHAAPPAWQQAPLADPLQELQRLSAFIHSLTHALDTLHQHSFVWLNFNPHAIEDIGPLKTPLTQTASADWRALRFMNLDIELFPYQTMPERVRVHPHFAAPEIVQYRVDDIGPRTDVFHLAAFAYYWLARQLPDGLPGAGLETYDYAVPGLRVFAPQLVEGIAPVVMCGLSAEPNDRQATPLAFAHAIDEAIINACRRRAFAGTLQWDAGGHTRTGRSKAELQRGNEDAILVKADEQAALIVVADGVSTCDVGSGGLASMMTTIMIENALAEGCTHETFPPIVASAAERGSLGLLEWAIAHDSREDLEAGKDLMGTTLTVGWLSGRQLSLANLGDSRAYLITPEFVEQLTVDGDLASDLLARGGAPEEVRELGAMARALRECVGGCVKTEDGRIDILRESCNPKIGRWPLVPGDVIVLCTDGLVEEGFFLEPGTLADIVRNNMHCSAAELALVLVEAADALQRVPTILEPDGFGDNISCVVVKIKG
jgi:serine/threonine protein phosphatase PrpC